MVKTDYQEGPEFNWSPMVKQDQHPEQQTTEDAAHHIVTTIKNIVNTFVTNQTETTIPTTTPQMGLNETFDGNNTMIGEGQTSFNEMFDSNSTVMQLNNTMMTEIAENNNTSLNEMFGSNGTTMELNSTMFTETATTDTTNLITDAVTTVVDTVVTTTESVFNTVSEVLTSTITQESATIAGTEETEISSGQYGDEEDKTLYIVLGVILAALLLIIVILLVIYKRYKAQNTSRSGVYCVTDLNEVSISSSHKDNNCDQHISKFT